MVILAVVAILMLLVAFVGSIFIVHICWKTDHLGLVVLFVFIATMALGILIKFVSLIRQCGVS